MTPNSNFFKKQDSIQASFDYTNNDLIDDADDCIICGKLLLKHTEDDANQCYSTLTKKQLIKKQLSKRMVKI